MIQFRYILIALCFLTTLTGQGQYSSPFNEKEITNAESGNYSFIVSGHFYGDGTNKSHFPVNTLLANLDWVNNSNSQMIVCLGDLFKDISNDIPNYKTSFFDKLEMPLVNSVGNHDLTGSIYQDNYGETAFSFEVNNDIHLVLDTERDNGDISGEQLELLKSIEKRVEETAVNNVFIYLHRTIWKEAYPEMEGIFEDNTQAIGGTNYESEVLPILKKMGAKADVHLFSGSLGTAPASFFHFYDQENNVRIMATAIRGLPRDAVLKVSVKNGEVSFETKSFTGQKLEPLEYYSVDFWQNEVGAEPFNWKLIPYYMELAITHRFFWYGAGFTAFCLFAFRFVTKRRKKKRSKI